MRRFFAGIIMVWRELRVRVFLRHLRVHTVTHSGRTLEAHLWGTYKQLRRWGADDEVCIAGLVHSIYGTQYFSHETISLAERGRVRRLIGGQAERLAYLFSLCVRPDMFRSLEDGEVEGRVRTSESLFLTHKDKKALLLIECANVLDQKGDPAFLGWVMAHHARHLPSNAQKDIRSFLGGRLL